MSNKYNHRPNISFEAKYDTDSNLVSSSRSPRGNQLVDKLIEYLKSNEWQMSINMFVEANCLSFQGTEYSHQHYTLWKTFQEIVEQILDVAMQSITHSSDFDENVDTNHNEYENDMKELEEYLERIANEPAKGPRDARVKELLQQLLSYHDFEAFSEMMKFQCEIRGSGNLDSDDSSSNTRNVETVTSRHQVVQDLLSLGFPNHLIQVVLDSYTRNQLQYISLEELVTILSDMNNTNPNESRGNHDEKDPIDIAEAYIDLDYNNSNKNNQHFKDDTIDTSYLSDFVNAINSHQISNNDNNNSDERRENVTVLEVQSRFTMAKSILDILDDGTTNKEIVTLLQYASDMISLQSQIKQLYECNHQSNNHTIPSIFIRCYLNLEMKRKKIDEEAISGYKLLSDNEISDMIFLNEIASQGTADEQLLHTFLLRHDEIQNQSNLFHQRIAIFISSWQCISRANLEELYIYLKENIASGVDLSSISDELYHRIYSLVEASKASDVVRTLLDLHLLEEEQMMLKQQINLLTSIVHSDNNNEKDNMEVIGIDDIPITEQVYESIKKKDAKDNKDYAEKVDSMNTDDIQGYHSDSSSNDNDNNSDDKISLDSSRRKQHEEAVQKLNELLEMEKNRRLEKLRRRLRNKNKSTTNYNNIHDDNSNNDEFNRNEEYLREEDIVLREFHDMEDQMMKGLQEKLASLSSNQTIESILSKYRESEKKLLESIAYDKHNSKQSLSQILEKKKRLKQQALQQILGANIPIDYILPHPSNNNDHISVSMPKEKEIAMPKMMNFDDWFQSQQSIEESFLQTSDHIENNLSILLQHQSVTIEDIDIDLDIHMNEALLTAYSKMIGSVSMHNKSISEEEHIKDMIRDEFNKNIDKYDQSMELLRQRAKTTLRNRLQANGNNKLSTSNYSSEEDSYAVLLNRMKIHPMEAVLGSSIVMASTESNTILESDRMHTFLDSHSQKDGSEKNKNQLKSRNHYNNHSSDRLYDFIDPDEDIRQALTAAHTRKEKELIEALHGQMLKKKIALEERLLRKREARMVNQRSDVKEDGENKLDSDSNDEILKLEKAFSSVLNLLKTSLQNSLKNRNNTGNIISNVEVEDNDSLSTIDINTLLLLMDRIAQGEQITDLKHLSSSVSSSVSHDMIHSSDSAKYHNSTITVPSTPNVMIDRSYLKQEAKRISTFAAEEQQKHDLTLKLQQAREKQNLQRKLMERRNIKLQQQQQQQKISADNILTKAGSHGYISSGLSPKQIQNQVSMRSMQSRGLNLTPMMRK